MKVVRSDTTEASGFRVIDGDTLECWLRVHHDVKLLRRIRVKGVEAGELPSLAGIRSQSFLQNLFDLVGDLPLHFVGSTSLTDNHGRLVGDFLWPDGTPLSTRLLQSGYYTQRTAYKPHSTPKPL